MSELLKDDAIRAAMAARDNQRVNELERVIAGMAEQSPHECKVEHFFGPGWYSRKIFMPKGTLLTSKIHATKHPYVVLSGIAHVWTERDGVVTVCAPYSGVTEPGTRRVIYIQEDCEWQTFHCVKSSNLEQIEAEIIMPHIVQKSPVLNGGAS